MQDPKTGALEYIDPRTFRLEEVAEASKINYEKLPSVFQTEYHFPIQDQLHHQACVAFSTARLLELYDQRKGRPYRKVSEAFIWIMCKKDDGLPLSSGTYIIQGMKSVNKYGYIYSDEWDKSTLLSQEDYAKDDIPENIKEKASHRKMTYGGVPTANEDEWRTVINNFGATLCPAMLSEDWWTANGQRTDNVPDPVPAPTKPKVYGHSMMRNGWNYGDVAIVNSWGSNWSKDGRSLFSPLNYPLLSMAYYFVDMIPEGTMINAPILPKIQDFSFTGNNVKYGDRSDYVKQLQIALRLLGYLTKDEFTTGYYGDYTKEAVYRFQFDHMQKDIREIQQLKGTQVGNKTNAELRNQLSILKKKALQINSGSDVPYILQSSQDPQTVSLTIKGALIALIPLGIFVAHLNGYTITTEQATNFITEAMSVVSAGLVLYGLYRKLRSKDSSENTI